MTVVVATVALIVLSAFFVAVEFSLMAVRRHRLEEQAPHSASARAALRSSSELTLILAGAQLGITVCTLGLGAITKPAVHHALAPLLADAGLPGGVADVASFVLALLVVTFLHLVVGEMAPKSWAIAHPERSAMVLALPMRAFMAVMRPILRALNLTANALIRKMGVEPVDELSGGQDADGLRHLVEHSANVGALSPTFSASVTTLLDLRQDTVADLMTTGARLSVLPATASVEELQELTRRTQHLRIPLVADGTITGVVHVRDTLTVADGASPAAPLARDPFVIQPTTTLHEALAEMRGTGHHLAVVAGEEPAVVTITDILSRLFPSEATPRLTAEGGQTA